MPELKLNTAVGPKVIDFIESYCRHTIGELSGQPLLLEQWQKDFVNDLYTAYWDDKRERWAYLYQSSLLGVPRGAGKSTLAAALCLAELSPMPWSTEAPRILISAVSRENCMQVYGPAADQVRLAEGRNNLQDFLQANKNTIWCEANRGELRRVAADGKAQFGHLPSFVVRDELHAWTSDKHVALSEALQTALAKRWNARSLTVTTAGHDKQTILGYLYDDALRSAYVTRPRPGLIIVRDPEKRFLMHWYEAPGDMPFDDPVTWRAAHPATWIDEDAVRAQLNDPSISQQEFERQWLNRWTKSKAAWFAVGVWRECGPTLDDPEVLEIPEDETPKSRIWIAVDGGWSDDCTAVTWSHATSVEERIRVRAHVWGTREETAHHTFVPGGTMDMSLVRDFIHDLAKRYEVMEVAYDPRFFVETAKMLSDDGFIMAEFPRAGEQMDHATMLFYRLVNSKGLAHDGDEVLTDHVESTAAVQTEKGWKIFKLKQSRKIDACVSALMSVSRCHSTLENENVIYAFRPTSTKRKEAADETAVQ